MHFIPKCPGSLLKPSPQQLEYNSINTTINQCWYSIRLSSPFSFQTEKCSMESVHRWFSPSQCCFSASDCCAHEWCFFCTNKCYKQLRVNWKLPGLLISCWSGRCGWLALLSPRHRHLSLHTIISYVYLKYILQLSYSDIIWRYRK